MNRFIEKLEQVVANSPNTSGNILLTKYVFTHEHDGYLEILVSLNNKSQTPHYLGHVFHKDGLFVATILALDAWCNPRSAKTLFDQFKYCIEERGCWYPIGGQVYSSSTDFDDLLNQFCAMLSDFNPNTEYADIDYRVVMLYPFPDPFRERLSFDEWLNEQNKIEKNND